MRKSLLMILFVLLGFTCIEAQNIPEPKLLQSFFTLDEEINGKIEIDLNMNYNIEENEVFTSNDFGIIPEVSIVYNYEDEYYSNLKLKFLGKAYEYRNAVMFTRYVPDYGYLSYGAVDESDQVIFMLYYKEEFDTWDFRFFN